MAALRKLKIDTDKLLDDFEDLYTLTKIENIFEEMAGVPMPEHIARSYLPKLLRNFDGDELKAFMVMAGRVIGKDKPESLIKYFCGICRNKIKQMDP